jgi:hypothetical protein
MNFSDTISNFGAFETLRGAYEIAPSVLTERM